MPIFCQSELPSNEIMKKPPTMMVSTKGQEGSQKDQIAYLDVQSGRSSAISRLGEEKRRGGVARTLLLVDDTGGFSTAIGADSGAAAASAALADAGAAGDCLLLVGVDSGFIKRSAKLDRGGSGASRLSAGRSCVSISGSCRGSLSGSCISSSPGGVLDG